jgi:hypothetical protein
MGRAIFWRFFSKTRLVTLVQTKQLRLRTIWLEHFLLMFPLAYSAYVSHSACMYIYKSRQIAEHFICRNGLFSEKDYLTTFAEFFIFRFFIVVIWQWIPNAAYLLGLG